MNAYDSVFDAIEKRHDISVSADQRKLLLSYLDLLLEQNKTLNLTRIDTVESALTLHIEDSLVALPLIDSLGVSRFCDMGSGGGFPGVPLSVVGGYQGVLIDSLSKKMRAVQNFIDTLGLGAQLSAVGLRSELYAAEQPASFDLVVTRALASLPVLLELASPLLTVGGYLLAYKGSPTDEELSAGLSVSKKLGFSFVSSTSVEIGEERLPRTLLLYKKTSKPQIKLPRRPGLAQKSPLT